MREPRDPLLKVVFVVNQDHIKEKRSSQLRPKTPFFLKNNSEIYKKVGSKRTFAVTSKIKDIYNRKSKTTTLLVHIAQIIKKKDSEKNQTSN